MENVFLIAKQQNTFPSTVRVFIVDVVEAFRVVATAQMMKTDTLET